jgi:hypothetical protein
MYRVLNGTLVNGQSALEVVMVESNLDQCRVRMLILVNAWQWTGQIVPDNVANCRAQNGQLVNGHNVLNPVTVEFNHE